MFHTIYPRVSRKRDLTMYILVYTIRVINSVVIINSARKTVAVSRIHIEYLPFNYLVVTRLFVKIVTTKSLINPL